MKTDFMDLGDPDVWYGGFIDIAQRTVIGLCQANAYCRFKRKIFAIATAMVNIDKPR